MKYQHVMAIVLTMVGDRLGPGRASLQRFWGFVEAPRRVDGRRTRFVPKLRCRVAPDKQESSKFVRMSEIPQNANEPRCCLAYGFDAAELASLQALLPACVPAVAVNSRYFANRMSVQEALVMAAASVDSHSAGARRQPGQGPDFSSSEGSVPVVLCSGLDPRELKALMEASGGPRCPTLSQPAFARAVPRSICRPLRQVLEEIADDHRERIEEQKRLVEGVPTTSMDNGTLELMQQEPQRGSAAPTVVVFVVAAVLGALAVIASRGG